jgi:transcriptional regulator with XRE-family HTH domain
MSPLRALREFMSQLEDHREFSTQAGFARLLGRSESLIRAVESGRVLLSGKLARELSARFGVPLDFLMKAQVDESEIRAIQSRKMDDQHPNWKPLTPEMADILDHGHKIARWKREHSTEPDVKNHLRIKLIRSVMVGMEDLFTACSDEELAVVTSELREWMYTRLAKMAKSKESSESLGSDHNP